jgi:hypothetical protein
MNIGTDQVQSLVRARRLLLIASQAAKPRLDPKSDGPSFKDVMEAGEVQQTGESEMKPPNPGKTGYTQQNDISTIDKLT